MSKIKIKIVGIDENTKSVLVKYASDSSKKSIDDYDAIAFQIENYSATNPDEFIERIRPTISYYVWERDLKEDAVKDVDISTWNNYEKEVDAVEIPVVPINMPTQEQLVVFDPEVKL